jgi:hypothetical protein
LPMRSILLLFLSLIVSNFAWAKPAAELSVQRTETSDALDFHWLRASYNSERHDPVWPFGDEASRGWSVMAQRFELDRLSLDFVASELRFGAWQKWNSWNVSGSVGVHEVNWQSAERKTSYGVTELGASRNWEAVFFHVRLASEFLYPRVLVYSGDPVAARALVAEPRVVWRISERQKLQLKYQSADFDKSDNRRSQVDGEWLWGFSQSPHWVWVGVGAEELRNSEDVSNYWSPEVFKSYGLRVDTQWAISDSLGFFFAGSLNRIREESLDWGRGHYLRTGIRYGDREESLFRLFYEDNRSSQEGTTWQSQGFGLELTQSL